MKYWSGSTGRVITHPRGWIWAHWVFFPEYFMSTDVYLPDFLQQTLPYTAFVTGFSCWASARFADPAARDGGWILIDSVDDSRSLLTPEVVPRVVWPTLLIQLHVLIYRYLHFTSTEVLWECSTTTELIIDQITSFWCLHVFYVFLILLSFEFYLIKKQMVYMN